MAKKAEAYVDTSAFIAFVDRSDSQHALFRQLFSDPPKIITTALVVAEGHGWFLRRYDRTRALKFFALMQDLAPLTIAPVGASEQAGATRLLRRFSDQDLTLTDAEEPLSTETTLWLHQELGLERWVPHGFTTLLVAGGLQELLLGKYHVDAGDIDVVNWMAFSAAPYVRLGVGFTF